MKFPNFNEEKKLWKQGFKYVAGLDEAGRGPLAGPVVAGVVCVTKNFHVHFKNIKINDSKKLSEKQREFFYEKLTSSKSIQWGIGIVSEKVIDKINIFQATKLAMQKAVASLEKNLKSNCLVKFKAFKFMRHCEVTDFLLIDGNFKIKSKIPQKSIVKGDQKVFSISAASIIAKVTRDRIMQRMHKKFPKYGFDKHKGYGTVLHIKNLKKFGLCKIHRKTFYPVSKLYIDIAKTRFV